MDTTKIQNTSSNIKPPINIFYLYVVHEAKTEFGIYLFQKKLKVNLCNWVDKDWCNKNHQPLVSTVPSFPHAIPSLSLNHIHHVNMYRPKSTNTCVPLQTPNNIENSPCFF